MDIGLFSTKNTIWNSSWYQGELDGHDLLTSSQTFRRGYFKRYYRLQHTIAAVNQIACYYCNLHSLEIYTFVLFLSQLKYGTHDAIRSRSMQIRIDPFFLDYLGLFLLRTRRGRRQHSSLPLFLFAFRHNLE